MTGARGEGRRTLPELPDEKDARLLKLLARTEWASGDDEGECETATLVRAIEARSTAAKGRGRDGAEDGSQ